MYNITLLSSFHIKLGKCNSDELYKIIESSQPQLIFEELPLDIFNIIYAEGITPQSQEAIAIKKYLTKYQIAHVPVDTYKSNLSDFFNGFDTISNNSVEYTDLCKQQ